jgi:hypothetical protein
VAGGSWRHVGAQRAAARPQECSKPGDCSRRGCLLRLGAWALPQKAERLRVHICACAQGAAPRVHLTRATPRWVHSSSAASARPMVGLTFTAVSCCSTSLTCAAARRTGGLGQGPRATAALAQPAVHGDAAPRAAPADARGRRAAPSALQTTPRDLSIRMDFISPVSAHLGKVHGSRASRFAARPTGGPRPLAVPRLRARRKQLYAGTAHWQQLHALSPRSRACGRGGPSMSGALSAGWLLARLWRRSSVR